MKNKREILIDTLRGSIEQLRTIPTLLDGHTIYTETGHVDTAFMHELLLFASETQTVVERAMYSVGLMLGVDFSAGTDKKKKKGADDGAKWDVREILAHCSLENNVLVLPQVQFNRKHFEEAKKWIEEAGGKWSKGDNGFVFGFDAQRVFEKLRSGERCNLAQDFQFFETPQELADTLANYLGDIGDADRVLEPSAGRGALVRAVHRKNPRVCVECYELMPENREFLERMENISVIGENFETESVTEVYDKIIANPPFCKNQDIRHVLKMYDALKTGGVMAAITSCHWRFSEEKVCKDFRQWLEDVGATQIEIGEGEFKESGTNTNTMMLVVNKQKPAKNNNAIQLTLFDL